MYSIITLAVLGMFWMVAPKSIPRWMMLGLTFSGLCLSAVLLFFTFDFPTSMLGFDTMFFSFGLMALVAAFLGVFIFSDLESHPESGDLVHPISLLLFATAGALVMISWTHLLTLFLGIEILSIPFYALAVSSVSSSKSQEAGLKYFLMGAFASGIFLFGMALYFAGSGLFVLDPLAIATQAHEGISVTFVGILLMMAGLFFKAGIVPFHAWVSDVYEGAPTRYVGWMGALIKVAIFAALLRFFLPLLPVFYLFASSLVLFSVFTMFLGNGLALFQTSLKRLFAFSGIAHTGYLLLAFLPASPVSVPTVIVFVFSYLLSVIGVFWVLLLIEKQGLELKFSALSGFWRRSPLATLVLIVSVFSLAGIPPFAGFFAKLGLVLHPLESGFVVVAIFAFVNFLLGITYYARVLMAAGVSDESLPCLTISSLLKWAGILILVLQAVISVASLFIL